MVSINPAVDKTGSVPFSIWTKTRCSLKRKLHVTFVWWNSDKVTKSVHQRGFLSSKSQFVAVVSKEHFSTIIEFNNMEHDLKLASSLLAVKTNKECDPDCAILLSHHRGFFAELSREELHEKRCFHSDSCLDYANTFHLHSLLPESQQFCHTGNLHSLRRIPNRPFRWIRMSSGCIQFSQLPERSIVHLSLV